MDYIWIAVAFLCGFLAKQINLPPLIGYLGAGFGLHALGFKADASISALADIGVMLLLFTVGLKIDLQSLFKKEVLAGASGHMAAIILITTINCIILAYFGLKYFTDLNWLSAALVGFAVSFSSTVCAVKMLEERGEMRARHGQVAIGILIIQDIAAVLFVVMTADTTPSWWALLLLALPLSKPLLAKLLVRSGHGEVLIMAGLFLAFSAGELFEVVGLKPHLGALIIGMLLSGHHKAAELASALLSFKDIFLIGFFLSIGFTALPTSDMLVAALIMAIAIPIKAAMFFFWLTQLKMRARSAFLTALSLANYSEFGLIVCSFSVMAGLLAKEWLVIMALAVSFSFIFSSILNYHAHALYFRWSGLIKRFESSELAHDNPALTLAQLDAKVNGISILVIGMGRVGTGAYDNLHNDQQQVCGIELDKLRTEKHRQAGRQVITADAEDPEFWLDAKLDNIELIMLAMPNFKDMVEAVKQLQLVHFQGKIAGIARYEDQRQQLLTAGVDEAFNFYAEAGAGFAEQSIHLLNRSS